MLKVVSRWRPNQNLRLAQIRCFLLAGPYCLYVAKINIVSAFLPGRVMHISSMLCALIQSHNLIISSYMSPPTS